MYLAIILICLGIFSLFFVRRIQEFNQAVVDRFVPITKTHPVTQTITPQHNGLNVIVIFLKNGGIRNTEEFIFTVLNTKNEPIRKILLSGSNIGDGETVRFQFDPIANSANQIFKVKLEAPKTDFSHPYIEAGFSNTDTYKLGQSEDINTPGDLSFQIYYHPNSKLSMVYEISQLISQKISLRLLVSNLIVIVSCAVTMKLVKWDDI